MKHNKNSHVNLNKYLFSNPWMEICYREEKDHKQALQIKSSHFDVYYAIYDLPVKATIKNLEAK